MTPGSGAGRDRCETVYGVAASEVSFYASLPEIMRFENQLCRILKRVRYLGGLRKCGYGQVADFEIEKTKSDWRECLIRDGKAARIIPKTMLKEYNPEDLTKNRVKPPYWLASGAEECVKPGAECALSDEVWLNAAERC